ncbi:hypothetical protein [Capnocytophaga felis]|uniref:Uncharacterized protein n=1 Tax=Capnocytophaga felis TaxID=2267611 RepID=A0A5M4BAZ3_9FLAO|nr:hypothetical protein [Capnocytophaga felis]GET46753.1 hypothetical protein RCZ01_20550 [Capnocytophaga felis]GET48453.1 hypothetical protein RCZ02_12840 [Capnocytophaga felis]
MSKSELKRVIADFENGKFPVEEALNKIQKITEKRIDSYTLENYWRLASLDDFCDELLSQPIENWQEITDGQALELIQEIIENIENDAVLRRNSEVLEKRYGKEEGFVEDLIFNLDINISEEILSKLKENTILYL